MRKPNKNHVILEKNQNLSFRNFFKKSLLSRKESESLHWGIKKVSIGEVNKNRSVIEKNQERGLRNLNKKQLQCRK